MYCLIVFKLFTRIDKKIKNKLTRKRETLQKKNILNKKLKLLGNEYQVVHGFLNEKNVKHKIFFI